MDQHTFTYASGKSEVTWDVRDFWEAAEHLPFTKRHVGNLLVTVKENVDDYDESDWERVKQASLQYPPILSPNGKYILDGVHRLVKMKQLGILYCDVKILAEMPLPIEVKGRPFKIKDLPFKWQTQ